MLESGLGPSVDSRGGEVGMDFMSESGQKLTQHPYLSGNFAPVRSTRPLTPCRYSGAIPAELTGGEYVRNGGNPVSNEDLGRDAHWFDGDGMLGGVVFTQTTDGVQPEFVNQYILTDIYLSTISSKHLRTPILPSIASLTSPFSSLFDIIRLILRTLILVVLSRLRGSAATIKRISVANTGLLFHDGRALATCESGPPMRIALPGLETVGWYNGKGAEGEAGGEQGPGFGGDGLLAFLKEWTTAHPRVDVATGELILFHSTFATPYLHYSIIPAAHPPKMAPAPLERPTRLLNAAVPGITAAKMMHDFGVSSSYTVIMDLPLSLDPLNLAKNKPIVAYDPTSRARFGLFPRHHPRNIRWFETNACCIFHTANTWDEQSTHPETGLSVTTAVNMLACRLTSASIILAAGDLAPPGPPRPDLGVEEEQCRLYYFQFSLVGPAAAPSFQFGLSAIPFEFPSVREDRAMGDARYVYGCSTSEGSFGTALGRAVKINCLVKIDAQELIARGKKDLWLRPVTGCVDMRPVPEILQSRDQNDPISIFRLPPGWYAQEPRFVPRRHGQTEDAGWLLTYAFDESQIDPTTGHCRPDAVSELWVIDAKDMQTVQARIYLPQRVPYGLHGKFFSEDQIKSQRPIESIRSVKLNEDPSSDWWLQIRDRLERLVG